MSRGGEQRRINALAALMKGAAVTVASAEGALSGLQYEDAPPGQGGFWARLFG